MRERMREVVVASVGPTTSETLRDLGLPVDVEPKHPKMGSLVAAAAERSEELRSSKKKGKVVLEIEGVKSCIQCQISEARFHEINNPKHLFCGSYCQWIKYTGAPDLRGKTPEEIRVLLAAYA